MTLCYRRALFECFNIKKSNKVEVIVASNTNRFNNCNKEGTRTYSHLLLTVLIIVIKKARELTLTFYLCLYMKAVVTEQGIQKKRNIILFPSLRFACFSQFLVLFHSHSCLLAILFLKSIVPIPSGIKGSIFRP